IRDWSVTGVQTCALPIWEQSLPSRQILRAPGLQLEFSGRPVDLALSPDGRTAYIKNMNNLLVVDPTTWTLRQTLNYSGSGASMRSEERRVGKEGMSGWEP